MPGGDLGRLQILPQYGIRQKKDTIPNATIKGAILGGDIMSIKIGAAYIRVSSDDQLEYSPDSQLKVIRDYAKREDYIIPDEYIYKDDGISGKSASKRPAFRLMIATAKSDNPPFDSIFVWKYSRFARNQEEAIMYKNLLKKKKIAVKSISEPSSDSPFASLIERIIEWMDEYYLINLSGEVRRGMKEKAVRGEAMGTAPFGYTVKDKSFIPNENSETVRYIFSQYAAGKGFRTLARELGEKGVRTQYGNVPASHWIKYILENPVYIGKIRWSTEGHANYTRSYYNGENVMVVDGKHLPIIDMEIWEKVQRKLKGRDTEMKYIRCDKPRTFMLKGLLRCGNCGATLALASSKPSLQCCNYTRGKCHVSHSITVKKANAAVINALEEVERSKSFEFTPRPPAKGKVVHEWDKLIAAEKNRLKRARSALLDGLFEPNEYGAVKAEIEENIKRLQAWKDSEAGESAKPIDKSAYAEKVLALLSVIRSPDIDELAKNEALRTIIDKIIYNKSTGCFDIYFAP